MLAKMKKQPEILKQFNEAFKKKIEQGIYRPLSEVLRENPGLEDAQKIFAPVVYSMKESSVNHKLRICVNQSFSVREGHYSFNDACLRGKGNTKLPLLDSGTYHPIDVSLASDCPNLYISV